MSGSAVLSVYARDLQAGDVILSGDGSTAAVVRSAIGGYEVWAKVEINGQEFDSFYAASDLLLVRRPAGEPAALQPLPLGGAL